MEYLGIEVRAVLLQLGAGHDGTLMTADSGLLVAQHRLIRAGADQEWAELLGAPIVNDAGPFLSIEYRPVWLPERFGAGDGHPGTAMIRGAR
jgi:hypothetical protein